MLTRAQQLTLPLHTKSHAWIPTGEGKSFKPLRFDSDGWSELMRLEPGAVVRLHRHTGAVHAFNLSGYRQIQGSDEIVGPGDYVYEPPGNVDSWQAVGDTDCIIHIKITGAVEYLDTDGAVIESADAASQHRVYLGWCRHHNIAPALQIHCGA
jgi:hypothetical protein